MRPVLDQHALGFLLPEIRRKKVTRTITLLNLRMAL